MKTKLASLFVAAAIAAAPAVAATQSRVPPGTRTTLALSGWLTSKDANRGDTFEATLVNDIRVEGRVVVPAGATFVGRVVEVERARALSKGGKLTLVIDRLVSGDGESAVAAGSVTGLAEGEDLEGGSNESGRRAGIGGAIGGALGAIVGGTAGLLVGLVVGAGGAIVAGKGKDVELPEGTQLLVKFDQEVTVTWSWSPQG